MCGTLWIHPTRNTLFFPHVHYTFLIDNQFISLSIVISDHTPIVLTMSLPDLPQMDMQWQFNSTLFCRMLILSKSCMRKFFFLMTNMSPDVSCLTVWDALKASLWGQIIAYTAQMKEKSHIKRLDLAHQIGEMDRQYANTKCPDLYKKVLNLSLSSTCSPLSLSLSPITFKK